MAIKDVRYYLCGIAVYSDGSIAATDGHRLHGNSLLHLKSHALEPIAVIPAKIIQLIKKLQKKGSLKLEILLGEYSPEKLIRQKYIRIELDNAKIECLAADGRYPEISQVIPKGTKELPQFTGNIICTDLKRATDIAKSASKYCVAKLVNGTAYTMRIDEKLELPINIDAPTALEIGTNTRYITDALFKNVSAEFKYTNSLNPMLIINTGTYAVVMPARL
jgi:DNA polymerase III sliding clamp (beta) subunit (PCNA family)